MLMITFLVINAVVVRKFTVHNNTLEITDIETEMNSKRGIVLNSLAEIMGAGGRGTLTRFTRLKPRPKF